MPGVKGRSGRRPKPTAQKALAGNPGKRALNKSEPSFSEITAVDPPEWMPSLAITMWETVVPQLIEQQVLSITDLHNVEAFCVAYSNWRIAQDHVTEHGPVVAGATGGPMKNPALTAAKEAMAQMVTFGSMLGLDPSSRQRLIAGRKKPAGNPFAELLGNA